MFKSQAMLNLRGLLPLALVFLSSCAGSADPQADAQAIRGIIERTQTMNNEGDIDGWTDLFEEGAVYMPPGQPAVTTREGLREVARAGFTRWRSQIRIAPDEIVPSGDWAFARSHVTGTTTPAAGGDPIAIDLKQIVVYHRQADGGWKIARLIGNSNSE